MINIETIREALNSAGYCSNRRIEYAILAMLLSDNPLLIEGAPGVGKTSLAKALAKGLGMPFIRVQMYEGLTADDILYDYDYQKQLLTLEAIKPKIEEKYKDTDISETIRSLSSDLDFFGEDFLIKRPVLRAITGPKSVLLFDEIDKASEEIEYMLYEFLEEGAITIPQYGEVRCKEKPIIFLTSNSYRELSGALKRRCNYLYIDNKTEEEVLEILKMQAGMDERIAKGIANCMVQIWDKNLKQMPSISEAIEFSRILSSNPERTKDFVLESIGVIAKNKRDEKTIRTIISRKGDILWNEEDEEDENAGSEQQ